MHFFASRSLQSNYVHPGLREPRAASIGISMGPAHTSSELANLSISSMPLIRMISGALLPFFLQYQPGTVGGFFLQTDCRGIAFHASMVFFLVNPYGPHTEQLSLWQQTKSRPGISGSAKNFALPPQQGQGNITSAAFSVLLTGHLCDPFPYPVHHRNGHAVANYLVSGAVR